MKNIIQSRMPWNTDESTFIKKTVFDFHCPLQLFVLFSFRISETELSLPIKEIKLIDQIALKLMKRTLIKKMVLALVVRMLEQPSLPVNRAISGKKIEFFKITIYPHKQLKVSSKIIK